MKRSMFENVFLVSASPFIFNSCYLSVLCMVLYSAFSFQEMESHSLGTSLQFDTFGLTATELARKQAEIEQQQRFL